MIEGLLYSAVVFTIFLVSHALWFHYRKPFDRWKVVVRFFLFSCFLYIIFFFFGPFQNILSILDYDNSFSRWFAFGNGFLFLIFLFLSYAQFYFLIDRGVSARILVEIYRSNEQRLTTKQIQECYKPEKLQKRRLDDMLYGGYIKYENGYYIMTKRGRRNAIVFDNAKKYLHLNPGG